jgi:hypothetical protein
MKDDVNDCESIKTHEILIPFNGMLNYVGVAKLDDK